MKQRFLASASLLATLLVVGALSLPACSGEAKPKGAASAQKAPEVPSAEAAATAANPALDPANARAGGPVKLGSSTAESGAAVSIEGKPVPASQEQAARYQGGIDKLQSGYDLSKVSVQPAAAEQAPVQDGSALTPKALAQKYKAHFSLAEGVTETKDLGKLRQGEVAGYSFEFVSDGEEPLIISGVKPSCGCTKADIELVNGEGEHKPYTKGDPIPVGQKFVLASQINTDGRQGAFNATITVYSNEVSGVFTARLTADIEQVLTITPSPSVYFGRITTADTRQQSVTIKTTRGEPFLLTLGQESVQETVKAVWTPKAPDAEGKSNEWTIDVTLGPNTEIGMRNYPIHFNSDLPVAHPKYPSPDGSPQYHGFILNVQAQVTGMVSAEPQFITFGMVRPGEAIERSFRIECHDDFKLSANLPTAFEGLQGQEFPFQELFKVTVVPQEDGRIAEVKVRLEGLPNDLNGSFGGVLKVKVGHPYLDEVLVRFSGVCRPTASAPAPVNPAPTPPGGK